jgi:hypothetical protein
MRRISQKRIDGANRLENPRVRIEFSGRTIADQDNFQAQTGLASAGAIFCRQPLLRQNALG